MPPLFLITKINQTIMETLYEILNGKFSMNTYYNKTNYEREYHQSVLKELIINTLYQINDSGHGGRYHINDPILSDFHKILEILLSLSKEETVLEVLKTLKNSTHFNTLANYFSMINRQYYNIDFFNEVLEIAKKFEKNGSNNDLENAINRFPREDDVAEHTFFQAFFKMNVSEMITFINNYDGKFLVLIFAEAQDLAKKYQSHKLINTLRKNLFKVKDYINYDGLVDVLEYAEDILERY